MEIKNIQALLEIERNLEVIKVETLRENKDSLLFDEPVMAKRLGIGYSTLKLIRQGGKITFVKIGRRILYRLSDIEKFISEHGITA